LKITNESGGRIEGSFRTAIETSPFYGSDVPITGVHKGAAIALVCAAEKADFAVSYTGKLEGGRMETLWFVVDGDADWWKSMTTNHDGSNGSAERTQRKSTPWYRKSNVRTNFHICDSCSMIGAMATRLCSSTVV
jgi:hypothetical protein